MKTTKVSSKIGITPHFFCLGAIIVLLSSCDVLESDTDVLEPAVEITGKEIYVMPNGESFIDLQSKVQTNQPARLAVTSMPRLGRLTELGKGILQYSPNSGSARGRDGFEVTVYSASNKIIKKDSVIIIIENDSTNLPCNLYPVTDYVYHVAPTGVSIDVTANDVICSNDISVAVYKPETSFPPYFGTAEVKDNNIVYYPGAAFTGTDKIMYKVRASNPERIAYGIVYINSDSSCSFSLSDDLYVYNTLTEGSALTLGAFDNDSLCLALNQYKVTIKSAPSHGNASLSAAGFTYQVPDSVGFSFDDYFMYEVCLDATCKTARIDIRLKQDSVLGCTIRAVSDSIDISKNVTGLVFLTVMKNDSICGNLKSFVIKKSPRYGTAFINEADHTIGYQRDPLLNWDDMLEYEICNTGLCSTASVFIKRTN